MNIIKDPKQLSVAQDAVFANPAYQPKADGETFCNLATQDVLRRMGYDLFDVLNVGGDKPFTADEMYFYISTHPEWLIKPMVDAQGLVNEGVILVAILPAVKLGQEHGHVNTLSPGVGGFSGHWDMSDPVCMNLGRAGTCFRSKGLSFAFVPIPEIYALVATL